MSLGKWITDKLLEQTKVKHVVAIYPGRFQPMAKHHVKTYNWFAKQFKDVYVTTSGKVSLPNSPFDFSEKKKIINSLGITKLVKVSKPYSVSEMLSKYDPETTAVVFLVGAKDKNRLSHSKFFHKWNGTAELGYKEGAYVITAPHISLSVPGYGEMSSTAIRKALGDPAIENKEKQKLFKDIFGSNKNYDLIVNKLVKLGEVMEGFCHSFDIPNLLKENVIDGESAVDDGPRGYWGNQASWKKFGKNVEKYINPGMEVLNYLTGNEEFFDHKTEFKKDMSGGPTGAVSYFPVGIPGGYGGTNRLKDKKGRAAFDRWASWSKYIATSVGYEFVNYLGAEISIKQNAKEPMKSVKPGELMKENLLSEGVNDKHIFKAVFLAGGPGSGKSSVVDAIFNNPDESQVKSLTSTGLKVINLDIAFEYLKKKHKIPVDAETFTKEQNSMAGKLMYQARMIAQKQMNFYLDGKLGVIIDGTGGSYNPIAKKKKMLEDLGYDCYMIFVDTTMKTAMQRNQDRNNRRLHDKVVKRSWKQVQSNKKAYKGLFGSNMKVVSTEGRQSGELPRGAKSHAMKFINSAIQNPIAKKWIAIAKKVME